MDNIRELFPHKPKTIQSDQLITTSDLEAFKISLLASIKLLITENKENAFQWLKSYQVRKLLGVSAGTSNIAKQRHTIFYKGWKYYILQCR